MKLLTGAEQSSTVMFWTTSSVLPVARYLYTEREKTGNPSPASKILWTIIVPMSFIIPDHTISEL